MFVGKDQARELVLDRLPQFSSSGPDQEKRPCILCGRPRFPYSKTGKCFPCYALTLPLKRDKKNAHSRTVQRNWRKANSLKRIEYRHDRMAQIKLLGGRFTAKQFDEVKRKQRYRCLWCNKQEPQISLTVDHIIPSTKWLDVIGLRPVAYHFNDIQNIQALCGPCNSSKSDRLLDKPAIPNRAA
jgi:5-methylcytosine-specific restriction endonuclease McrA